MSFCVWPIAGHARISRRSSTETGRTDDAILGPWNDPDVAGVGPGNACDSSAYPVRF